MTINAGAGDDAIIVSGFAAGFAASLTIDGQDGDDTVLLNTNLVLGSATSAGNLTISAEEIALHGLSIFTNGDQTNNDAGSVSFVGNVTLIDNLIDVSQSTSATQIGRASCRERVYSSV